MNGNVCSHFHLTLHTIILQYIVINEIVQHSFLKRDNITRENFLSSSKIQLGNSLTFALNPIHRLRTAQKNRLLKFLPYYII